MATYNGWSNYETWRIHLELISGMDPHEMGWPLDDTSELRHHVRDFVEELISGSAPEGLARDYALSFVSAVDWYEIAEHLIADYAETAE
jgi:hypothetical protein